MEDIAADEYKIEENNKVYILKIGITNNKINLNLSTGSYGKSKNYTGEFTLDDLRQINRVFLLTSSIYEAREEFKKAIERKKIAISERDDYVHIIFYMMIGTDTATLSVALPRDETPRIIRLEQRANLLKLGRDNLRDRLTFFEKETDDIKRIYDEIQMDNSNLQQIAESIGQGIPNVSQYLRPPPQPKMPPRSPPTSQMYSSQVQGQGVPIQNSQQMPQMQSSQLQSSQLQNSQMQNPNITPNIVPEEPRGPSYHEEIEPSYHGVDNREPSYGNNENKEPSYHGVDNKEEPSYHGVDNNRESSYNGQTFQSGILNGIVRNEMEIQNVLNKVQTMFPGSRYKLLFKGTIHGDTSSAFHSRCDSAEKTLVLVEDSMGNRFGGFTSKDWGGQYLSKTDDNAFIFSIDSGKIFDIIPGQNAIGCYPNFGPVFFGCQIRIYDNFFTKGGTTFKKGLNYRTSEDFELTKGNQNFGVREVEVYEVSNY